MLLKSIYFIYTLYHVTWSDPPSLIPQSWDNWIEHFFKIPQLSSRNLSVRD